MKNRSSAMYFPSDYGNMTLEDALDLYQMIEKKELLQKYTLPQKPSSDGFYHIYVADQTKASGRRQFKAKTIEALKEKILEYEHGINGHAKKTFSDCFKIVQEQKLMYVKNPEKKLSVQNTITRNKSEYKRFFENSEFEKKYISEISKPDIENIILLNLKRYEMRKKSLDSMKAILRAVFELANNEHWITDNPYSRIDFRKFQDMLIESASIEKRVHSNEEIKRMLDFIHEWQKKKPFYIPAYALEMQILTAMRRGELPPLQWDDIINGAYIFIHREQLTIKKQNSVPEHFEIVEHTKTYKNRKFPITNELRQFLARLYVVHSEFYPDSKFLFPADTDNGCITNNHVYQFYRRMCKKLGIEICKEVIKGTHAFRRTRITEVINRTNGNIIMASELFGNSPEVAKKNYFTGIDLDLAKEVLSR